MYLVTFQIDALHPNQLPVKSTFIEVTVMATKLVPADVENARAKAISTIKKQNPRLYAFEAHVINIWKYE